MDNKYLLKLIDVALNGDKNLAQMVVRQFASKVRNSDKNLYKLISEKLELDILRSINESSRPLPVDADSRQQLVKYDDVKKFENAPIHSESIRDLLHQVILERNHLDELFAEGLFPTKSILLQGPPGLGKTMTAQWLANQLNLPLLTLDLATVMSSFLGKTGSNVRAVLNHAMSFPCVLLLDEFDAIAKRRDDDRELGELKRLVTVLLQSIDDWPHTSLLLAATNHGELLDPAIWRRFDLEVTFSSPTCEMISLYLKEYWPDFIITDEILERFKDMSFSNIDRELRKIKREKFILNLGLKKHINISSNVEYLNMSMDDKKQLVIRLHNEGFSQRAISEKIGISRPTVKKTIDNI